MKNIEQQKQKVIEKFGEWFAENYWWIDYGQNSNGILFEEAMKIHFLKYKYYEM